MPALQWHRYPTAAYRSRALSVRRLDRRRRTVLVVPQRPERGVTDRWHLPGPGEDALDWFFGAGTRVLGLKSIDLNTAWAKGLPRRCKKCCGTGTVGKGLDLAECHACRGFGSFYGAGETPDTTDRHPARVRFQTRRCDACRGGGLAICHCRARRVKACACLGVGAPCVECGGRGYVDALTVDHSAMAREGAVPDVNDAALRAYGKIARRVSAAGWRAEVVLSTCHGDVGHRRGPRVALMLMTASGRKMVALGRARSRRLREVVLGRTKSGHLRDWAAGASDRTDYDFLSEEMALPESRVLKREAEAEVDALLSFAYSAWNAVR